MSLKLYSVFSVTRTMTTSSWGWVIVRQRPGTAKGFVFLTLEDETGGKSKAFCGGQGLVGSQMPAGPCWVALLSPKVGDAFAVCLSNFTVFLV